MTFAPGWLRKRPAKALERFNQLLFELGAVPYDILTRHRAWREDCRRMLEPFGPPGGRVIIDLGCGPAMSAIEFALQCPGDRVFGLDISAPMLRLARKNAARERASISLARGSALALPFRTGGADVLAGHSFLYLLPDQPRTLAEMMRVLRPGGHLVLVEPVDRARMRGVLEEGVELRFIASMLLWRIASGQAGRFSQEDLKRALEVAGFTEVRVEPTLHGMGLQARARRPG